VAERGRKGFGGIARCSMGSGARRWQIGRANSDWENMRVDAGVRGGGGSFRKTGEAMVVPFIGITNVGKDQKNNQQKARNQTVRWRLTGGKKKVRGGGIKGDARRENMNFEELL